MLYHCVHLSPFCYLLHTALTYSRTGLVEAQKFQYSPYPGLLIFNEVFRMLPITSSMEDIRTFRCYAHIKVLVRNKKQFSILENCTMLNKNSLGRAMRERGAVLEICRLLSSGEENKD